MARYSLAILTAGIVFIGCHRMNDQEVALVNGKPISADQYRERYKTYIEKTGQRDNILLRKQVLDNMINEILIYDDIHDQKLDRDSVVVRQLADYKREALAMGYAKRITLDTMTMTHAEVAAEFLRYKTKVHARYLYAPTEEEAWNLRNRLEHGETFEALAKTVFQDPGLSGNGGDLGVFGWGEMEPALEDAAYSLPIGEISKPIKIRIGYAIVRVEKRFDTNPLASETDFEKVREKLENSVTKRKMFAILDTATNEVVKQLSPKFNDDVVNTAFNNWKWAVGEDSSATTPAAPSAVVEQMDKIFVQFSDKQWTLKDFFDKFRHTTRRERRLLRTPEDFRKFAIGLAARDVMIDRAYAEGLDRDTDVTEQINRLSGEYLLRHWASTVQDTVGSHGFPEDTLRKFFEANRGQYQVPPEVNVAEILLRTRSDANRIMKQLQMGKDFSTLAKEKSIRLWAAKRGGELGFGTKSNYGILGDTIFKSRVGQVIGPAFVDPYYGIFKILAKKEGRLKSYEESRPDVVTGFSLMKKQDVFRQAVAYLRGHARVDVNNKALEYVSIK